MASKLGLLLIAFAFLLPYNSLYCSASGRLLNPKKLSATIDFGLDPHFLLKPTFPLPEDQETQTPPSSTLPMPLQQPITPPPPAFPAGQGEASLIPAFPFPHLPSLPKFPPFPFIPTMPSVPALPSVPLPPQFVGSDLASPGIGSEGSP